MVDINNLLAPISEEAGTGSYLKLDRSAYRSLRNNYNAAQSSFRQLLESPDASSDETLLDNNHHNWLQLRDSTYDALTQSSKDLELLGWYIASQLFTSEPHQNLADTSLVLTQFIETYWSTLHPTLPEAKFKSSDEAGKARELVEFRIKPLLQLLGESTDSTALYMPLQLISLIDEITFADYLRAERQGQLATLKEQACSLFSTDVAETLSQLADIHQNFSNAESLIAKECQAVATAPVNFKFVKSNIADLINAIRFLTEEKFELWPLDNQFRPIQAIESQPIEQLDKITDVPIDNATQQAPVQTQAEPAATVQSVTTESPVASQPLGQINNRDQAFHELRRIADYFKESEPHSPISFLLERAIRWGYLSLPELLQEITGGNGVAIEHINQVTGMDNLGQQKLKVQPVLSPTVKQNNTVTPEKVQASTASDEVVEHETTQTTTATTPETPSKTSDFEW